MVFAVPESPWYAINVRSNQEKVADALLREKGYDTFCPLQPKRSRRTDKTIDLEQPLFPGYLFCQFEHGNRGPVVTLSPVVRVVGVGRTPMPVDLDELQVIRDIVASGVPYKPWPYLNVGERVKLTAGPLAGMTGILTADRGEDRVVVSVGLIQRSVAAEVSRAWLAPARSRREVSVSEPLRSRAAAAGRY